MKISNNTSVNMLRGKAAGGKKASTVGAAASDSASVEGLDQLRQMAADLAKASEAGRAERIAEIKDALERGEYHVPAKDLSVRIVGAASLERGVW